MSVVLSVADVGPCKKELRVEVPQPAVDAERQRVVREFAREARLPGFRKGRVPEQLLRQRFAGDIEKEVIDRLVPRYWQQAQAEQSLRPMGGPRVEKVEMSPGTPMVFVATVEVEPEVELGADRTFEVPELAVEPQAAEIDEVIERLGYEAGSWQGVERGAARGDRVRARLHQLAGEPEGSDAELPPEAQEVAVEVGGDGVWEELSLALTGLVGGQRATFARRHVAAHQEGEEPHEHAHHYRLEVAAVEERSRHPLDDALAHQITGGELSSLEELRQRVGARIRADKERLRARRREQAVLEQLSQRHPVALPEGAIGREVEGMLEEYAENLMRGGVDLHHANIDWEGVRTEMRPDAERRLRSRVLLDAVARADRIEVGESDLEAALQEIARVERKSAYAVRQTYERDGRIDALRSQLRRSKTLRRLLGESDHQGGGE